MTFAWILEFRSGSSHLSTDLSPQTFTTYLLTPSTEVMSLILTGWLLCVSTFYCTGGLPSPHRCQLHSTAPQFPCPVLWLFHTKPPLMLYDLACCWALAAHTDSGTPQQLTHPVTCEQTKAGEEKGIVWSSLGKHVFGFHPSMNAVDRLSLLSSLCAWHCVGSRDTSETDIVPTLLAVPPCY